MHQKLTPKTAIKQARQRGYNGNNLEEAIRYLEALRNRHSGQFRIATPLKVAR